MKKAINLKEKFPHLNNAPIVEAVLEIRVVPSVDWDANNLQNKLKNCLPDYPKKDTMRETILHVPPGSIDSVIEDGGCVGLKLHSNDNLHITQFKKGAFVFSRLKPYSDWGKFSQEALRLWDIYCDLLKPREVRRIGLRFINRLPLKQQTVEFADYYKNPPSSIKDLSWPLTGYLHQDRIQVPDTQYFVNVIKTVQNMSDKIGLLLDIDVFIQQQFNFDEVKILECMNEMSWIKNKIFFSSLTDKAIEECK